MLLWVGRGWGVGGVYGWGDREMDGEMDGFFDEEAGRPWCGCVCVCVCVWIRGLSNRIESNRSVHDESLPWEIQIV